MQQGAPGNLRERGGADCRRPERTGGAARAAGDDLSRSRAAGLREAVPTNSAPCRAPSRPAGASSRAGPQDVWNRPPAATNAGMSIICPLSARHGLVLGSVGERRGCRNGEAQQEAEAPRGGPAAGRRAGRGTGPWSGRQAAAQGLRGRATGTARRAREASGWVQADRRQGLHRLRGPRRRRQGWHDQGV